MKAKTVIVAVGVAFLVLIGLGAIGSLLPTQNQPTTNSLSSGPHSSSSHSSSGVSSSSSFTSTSQSSGSSSLTTSTSSIASSNSPSSTTTTSGVTLEEIIAGNFPSATDKQGTGGVTITVHNLLVLYVRDESDGDWHVAVTDGQVNVFITEITPTYQSTLSKPLAGSTIDETGVPYCDTYHETESWHGDTCWEIHPVTSWQTSSGTTVTYTSTQTAVGLNVSISYESNPISRGSTQTIYVGISDSDGPVSNTQASIHVLYASGQTTKDFTCTTLPDGSCSASWTIGGNSTPGTFQVTVTVEGMTFYSSFEVTTA